MSRVSTGVATAIAATIGLVLLAGCGPSGPPVELTRGVDGEAQEVFPVTARELRTALGDGGGEGTSGDAADGLAADDADDASRFRYRFDPPMSVGAGAVSVSTRAGAAGTRLWFLGPEGDTVSRASVPAAPTALAVDTVEVVVPLGRQRAAAMVLQVPEGFEPEDTETSIVRLAPSAPFDGASVGGASFRIGAAATARISESSSLEWEVRFADGPAAAHGTRDTASASGRVEIDYVYEGEPDASAEVVLEGIGDAVSYTARLSRGAGVVSVPAPALGFRPERVVVRSESSGVGVVRVERHRGTARAPRAAPSAAAPDNADQADGSDAHRLGPIPADLGTILSEYPREAWRRDDFELFSWSAYPAILVVDTADYEVQARLFKRLAFFVEKRGYRGTLLSDSELVARHGWNAHNYRGEGLAAFFNRAAALDFELNRYELLLREIVLANGVIVRGDDGFRAGEGGVLSVSRQSYPVLRELLVTHEAFHGVYYREPAFRAAVAEAWNGLSDRERSYWRRLLAYMTYDPADEYLMMNEFQAYLLQQPVERARAYLRGTLSPRFARARPGIRPEIEAFLSDFPDTFRKSAAAVAAGLERHSPLRAGEVVLLTRSDGSSTN